MDYGITIERATGEWVWRAEVRHLTPVANQGRHGVYIDAWDKGRRANAEIIFWRSPEMPAESRKLDKYGPLELGHGMIDIYPNDTITVKMAGETSDTVSGLHTRHPDELGHNGEIWNSYGHHSFKVVFRLTKGEAPPVVVPPLTVEDRLSALELRVAKLEG